MGSVISINSHRPAVGGEVAPPTGSARFGVSDVISAVDPNTRKLLGRGRLERRAWLVPRGLLLADLIGLSVAYVLTTLFWGEAGAFGTFHQILVFLCTLPCWVIVAKLQGLYRSDQEQAAHSTADDVVGVFHLVTIGIWVFLVASRVGGRPNPSVFALITFWALAICILPVFRTVTRRACKRSRAYAQNTVIVGAGEIGQLIGRKLVKHPEYGINVVGFVDRDPKVSRADLPEHLGILGGPERLPEIVKCLDVERVIIAFSSEPVDELLALLRKLREFPVQIDLVPRLFELVGPRVTMHSVEGLPLLGLPPNRPSRTSRAHQAGDRPHGSKHRAGRFGSRVCLHRTARSARFRGSRVLPSDASGDEPEGIHGADVPHDEGGTDKRYTRRRSEPMPASAECTENGGVYKLEHADALTNFGRRLQRTSLDELPLLINVLRGDMSLVGPRPCIPDETDNFEPHHMERFDMPQGITGLWQVTARAKCTYSEALDMDVAYVRSWSLGLDLRLLLRTPLQVLRQRSSTA